MSEKKKCSNFEIFRISFKKKNYFKNYNNCH